MKDRNGETLQVGDVCIVHETDGRLLIEESIGELVVVERIYTGGNYPIACHGCFSLNIAGTCFNPRELEIVGDVR